MDKITFTWILQCALMTWEGYSKDEMLELGASTTEITAGIELCNYLRPINLDSNDNKKQTNNEIELNNKHKVS